MRDYPESSNDYSKVYSEKWIQNVILQNKGKFGLSLFSSIFRSLVLLLPTLLVKQIINRSIPQGNIPILILLSCVNVSIYFVTTTLIILDLHLEKYILDAFGTLRRDMYRFFLEKPLREFAAIRSGDTISKIVDETEGLANFFYFGFGSLIWINTTVFAGMAIMAAQNLLLAALTIALMILRIVLIRKINKKQEVIGQKINETNSRVNQTVKEQMSNILFIKATASEEKELNRVQEALSEKYRIQRNAFHVKGKFDYKHTDTFMGFHCGNTCSKKLASCEMKYQMIMARSLPVEVTNGTLEGDIAPGDITFYRLQSTSDNKIRAYVAQGEVLPVATRSFGSIGVFAIPEMGRFYRHVLIEKNYPHHGAVAFGHYGKALFEVFKYLGVPMEDINYNQPASLPYPTENPFA